MKNLIILTISFILFLLGFAALTIVREGEVENFEPSAAININQ